jgi:hypothetical protein
MAKDPAFLFYSSDFLNGVADLTMEERGQYITLLCLQHQKGSLSEKTIRLQVGSVSVDVLKKFVKDKEGNYYQERLKDEIEKRANFTESRRNNGFKGGRPKANAKPNGYPKNNLMEDEDDNEDVNINKDDNEKLEMPFTSENFIKYWGIWKDYKKKEYNFKFKSIASEQAALNKLVKLSQGYEATAIKIIEESLANNWKGFFQLKNENNGNNNYSKSAPKVTPEQLHEAHIKFFS